jgi:hypothetical protein
VSWSGASGEWDASITLEGGRIALLGSFAATARGEVDAALAYDAAARAAGRPAGANFDPGSAAAPPTPPVAPAGGAAAAHGAAAAAAVVETDSDDDWL